MATGIHDELLDEAFDSGYNEALSVLDGARRDSFEAALEWMDENHLSFSSISDLHAAFTEFIKEELHNV